MSPERKFCDEHLGERRPCSVCGHIANLEAERDRYREALRSIVADDDTDGVACADRWERNARRALGEMKP